MSHQSVTRALEKYHSLRSVDVYSRALTERIRASALAVFAPPSCRQVEAIHANMTATEGAVERAVEAAHAALSADELLAHTSAEAQRAALTERMQVAALSSSFFSCVLPASMSALSICTICIMGESYSTLSSRSRDIDLRLVPIHATDRASARPSSRAAWSSRASSTGA